MRKELGILYTCDNCGKEAHTDPHHNRPDCWRHLDFGCSYRHVWEFRMYICDACWPEITKPETSEVKKSFVRKVLDLIKKENHDQ